MEKNEGRREEFVMCGYFWEKDHTIRLILGKYRPGGVVYKGHVGCRDGDCQAFIARLKKGDCPVVIYPVNLENAVWCVPEHVCIVEYTGNNLHSSRFLGFRDDICQWEVIHSD